jgi:hypothetical protein
MNTGAGDEAAIETARLRPARDLVGRMLGSHGEARSLLSEASHRSVLAGQSSAAAGGAGAAADLARVRYEELRHRADPRAECPLSCWTAAALVASAGAGLAGLAWLELAGLPGRAVAAAAVAAVWITGAWLVAADRREGHAGRAAAAWTAAVALAALLTAVHAVAAPGWGQGLAGLLWAVLSGAMAAAAAALISRSETAALTRARRQWQRARARHATAARRAAADAEGAAIARQSWLSLVGSVAARPGDEQLARGAAEVAASMI